jgi:pheromone shutdown protein TraB
MLARHATTEDLPDVAEALARDQAQALMELLLDRRDALLAAALDEVLAQHRDEAIDIAVVYGSRHMPALTRYLVTKHGFRPCEAE